MYTLIDRPSGRIFAAGQTPSAFFHSLRTNQQFVYFNDCLPDYHYRAYIALLALDVFRSDWDLIRNTALGVSSNLILLHVAIGG